MSVDLSAQGRQYQGQRLLERDVPREPFTLFQCWLQQALEARLLDATAMVLATSDAGGQPSARVVLLKGHDARGFVFFTRYSTRKCRDLALNRRGALLFHWRELDRQVRIEAEFERVSQAESEAYFATRPRGSQLAARAASGQDRVSTPDLLLERFEAEERDWQGRPVPMPEDWGGYRAGPRLVEFWQGRPNRLHDRLVYELDESGEWLLYRLAP